MVGRSHGLALANAPRVLSDDAIRAREDRVITRALKALDRRARIPGQSLGDVSTCEAFFRLRLGGEAREHFEVAFLDGQHRLIAVERLFSGSVSGAEVHPRVVVRMRPATSP